MKRNYTIPAFLILVALVLLGVFWWLPDATANQKNTDDLSDAALEFDNSQPLTGDSEAATENRGTNSAGPLSNDQLANESTNPDKLNPSGTGTTVEDTEQVHIPVYGELVKRGGAIAKFQVLDARDQPLVKPAVGLQLWRKVGVRWIEDEAYWDDINRRVVCDGLSSGGLEPGEYELLVLSGVYGDITHRFQVRKNEVVEDILRMPTWRRIICFDFKKLNGDPVDWVWLQPRVKTEPERLEVPARKQGPAIILRDPPRPSSDGRGGRGGFSFRRTRGSGTPGRYLRATDAGLYYVPVIAGATNTVRFSLRQEWGTKYVEFSGTFEEQEWDRKEVVLDLVHDFDEVTSDWSRFGEDNPGARDHLEWIKRLQNLPAIDDPANVPHRRLIIEVDAPKGISVAYQIPNKLEDKTLLDRTMQSRGQLHYVNAYANQTVRFALYRLGQKISRLETHTFTTEDETPVHRIRLSVNSRRVPSPVWVLPPTLDAWAIRRQMSVVVDWDAHKADRLRVWNWDISNRQFNLTGSFTGLLTSEDPPTSARLDWHLGGTARRTASSTRTTQGMWNPGVKRFHGTSIPVDELRSKLPSGTLTPPELWGLVFRAIGPRGEGLPWIEASVVSIEQDERAQRLRAIETTLQAEDARPALGTEFANDFAYDQNALDAENIDAERLKQYLGERFLEQSDDPKDLAYYSRRGAWYNTHSRLKSDDSGYAYSQLFGAPAGKKYVLYLWSNSRNDLEPDARIVFESTGELTDLGAIELPTYSK